jgi:hypothetical protein
MHTEQVAVQSVLVHGYQFGDLEKLNKMIEYQVISIAYLESLMKLLSLHVLVHLQKRSINKLIYL